MPNIMQITNKIQLADSGKLFTKYVDRLGVPGTEEKFFIRVFTSLDKPDTLFLLAFEDDESVGFLWAVPIKTAYGKSLRVVEWFSDIPNIGIKMFGLATKYAKDNNFISIQGLVSVDQAQAMQRLLNAKPEAVLLKLEVKGG